MALHYVCFTLQVLEYCDRGSLADLIADGKLGGDAARHEVWALLCLLDIAQVMKEHALGVTLCV